MTAYRYVRTGRLPATQHDSRWWVEPADLAAASKSSGGAGRHGGGAKPTSRAAASRRLENRLVAGDEPGAWSAIDAALASGATPDEVVVEMLAGAMRSIGDSWEAGEYTVDDEHRATGVALRLVARLGSSFTRRGPKKRPVILATPPGELHGLPTAMAANVLRGNGYEVVDLGADVPVEALVAAVGKLSRPLALALAVTSGNHDRAVRSIVRALHTEAPGLPVLVGGSAIGGAEHAERLGARWTGTDAISLVAVVSDVDADTAR